MYRHVLALALALGLVSSGPTAAQQYSAEIETTAGKIFETTMSPFCPGRTIATCPSPQAADLRDEIKGWVAAGLSTDSIQRVLYARYGEVVRATPRAEGFELIAWVVPGLVLVLGAALLLVWMVRVRRTAAPTAPDRGSDLDREDRSRLERELSRF